MALRSFFHGSQRRRKAQRATGAYAGRRLRFETFEDRRMLSLTPAGAHSTIGTPSYIVTADFNNDGNLDLATCADAATGSVSVLLGDGAGGFAAAQRTVFGSQLRSLAVADFNNDTKPDLLVSEAYNGACALVGNGDGTFQPAVPLNLNGGAGKEVVALGRSGHGFTEIVVTWLGPDWQTFIQVYSGSLQGGFTAGPDASYRGWSGITAVDLNNDGHLDVVTGDGVVFLGDIGHSLNLPSQPYPLTGGAVATGDFTGDGNADVIVAGYSIATLRGRGDGSLDAPIHHSANGIVHSAVATADFNADGKLDAIVTDNDKATVSVMLGNGDGTLRYAGAFATGSSMSGVVVGDFNGDGRPDVAVSHPAFESRTVSVLLNDGDWPPALLGDYNRDGIVDAADYVLWRKTRGTAVVKYSGADGSGNGVVDQDDYGVWRAHVGQKRAPTISISDATVTEGNTGSTSATFTLTLEYASAVDVTVNFSTVGVTAYSSDFTSTSGTATIPAGQTSRTFAVAVLGDRLPESTETFDVYLSAPTNTVISDGQAIGTILDNEPRISINNVSKSEGMSGKTLFTFTVTLSAAYDEAVTMSYRTVNGTATTSDNDYTAKTSTLSFAPGETSKTITIEVKGDTKKEADEEFYVELFNVSGNSLVAVFQGVGTIWNDDN